MSGRHKLVWLSDRGWQYVLDNVPENHRGAVDRWHAADWPAVVRRADVDAPAHQVCLGIALPPAASDGSKTRIAIRAPSAEVTRMLDPLPVRAVLDAAPEAWREQLGALDAGFSERRLSVRVYGSMALQAITGLAYLTPASDIDLLFYPGTVKQLYQGVEVLASLTGRLPLDGEIVFPSGEAVAWKEWVIASDASGSARVMVKDARSVHLSTTAALLSTLEHNHAGTGHAD